MEGIEYFYKNLSSCKEGLSNVLANSNRFKMMPEDWYIIVVDVESSTQAVKHKLHHPVNFAAALSVSSVLSELRSINEFIEIPFFFGGDGATFVVPDSCSQQLILILENVKKYVYDQQYLVLRVGAIQLKELNRLQPSVLQIAKVQLNKELTIPVVHGDALINAEAIIKKKFTEDIAEPRQDMIVDFEGCKCRWEKMPVSDTSKKVLCFVTAVSDCANGRNVLLKISEKLDEVFGDYMGRLPLTKGNLSSEFLHEINTELKDHFESLSVVDNISIALGNISDKIYSTTDAGKEFTEKFRASSLAMLVDGNYDDIVLGTTEQIEEFLNFLQSLEQHGELTFGHHVTNAAILSCYVVDKDEKFIQLIDGDEGGFSAAAKLLKSKLKSDEN